MRIQMRQLESLQFCKRLTCTAYFNITTGQQCRKLDSKHLKGIEMSTTLSKLPISERIKLVEELWDSIAFDQKVLPLTAEQKSYLDSRLDAYETDGNRGRIASEAILEIRRGL